MDAGGHLLSVTLEVHSSSKNTARQSQKNRCESFLQHDKAKHRQFICGDYNTAHKEIDLARPKENSNTTGFLPEERAWINKIIDMKYIDIFREFNSEPGQYTYWDQITRARDRNVGWRIDYYLISEELGKHVKAAPIHQSVMGSDHCPIELNLSF